MLLLSNGTAETLATRWTTHNDDSGNGNDEIDQLQSQCATHLQFRHSSRNLQCFHVNNFSRYSALSFRSIAKRVLFSFSNITLLLLLLNWWWLNCSTHKNFQIRQTHSLLPNLHFLYIGFCVATQKCIFCDFLFLSTAYCLLHTHVLCASNGSRTDTVCAMQMKSSKNNLWALEFWYENKNAKINMFHCCCCCCKTKRKKRSKMLCEPTSVLNGAFLRLPSFFVLHSVLAMFFLQIRLLSVWFSRKKCNVSIRRMIEQQQNNNMQCILCSSVVW